MDPCRTLISWLREVRNHMRNFTVRALKTAIKKDTDYSNIVFKSDAMVSEDIVALSRQIYAESSFLGLLSTEVRHLIFEID